MLSEGACLMDTNETSQRRCLVSCNIFSGHCTKSIREMATPCHLCCLCHLYRWSSCGRWTQIELRAEYQTRYVTSMAGAKCCDSSAYAPFGVLRASAAIGYDRGCIVHRSCITTMDAMDAIFEVIAQSPAMAITLSFTQIFHFIVHCARLKHDIILT